VLLQFYATRSPTGFGPADLHHVSSGRAAAKVVVETDNPVHLGSGQVQQFRYPRHHLGRNVSQGFLDFVENQQQGTRLVGKPGRYVVNRLKRVR
jgi:hypothetical protein